MGNCVGVWGEVRGNEGRGAGRCVGKCVGVCVEVRKDVGKCRGSCWKKSGRVRRVRGSVGEGVEKCGRDFF